MSTNAEIRPRLRRPTLAEATLHGGVSLFVESFYRYFFSKRSLVLSLLFLAPCGLILLPRSFDDSPDVGTLNWLQEIQYVIILTFAPTALLSFAALLNNVGLIQDEIEEQTLTYLLLRPTPRWMIYLAKLLAATLATMILACVFHAIAYACLFANTEFFANAMSKELPATLSALAVTTIAYSTVFGLIGLLLKRSLVIGIVYIVMFEGILASIPFNFRSYTVIYYFRVLCHHWIGVPNEFWGLQSTDLLPTPTRCIVTLLTASVVFALIGALYTQRKEFRMKTPAGA